MPYNDMREVMAAVLAQRELEDQAGGAPAFLGGQVVSPGTFDERFGTLPPAGGTTEIPRTPPVQQRFPTGEEELTPYAPEPQQVVGKEDYTYFDQEADAYQRFLQQQMQQQQTVQTPTGTNTGTTPQSGGGGQLSPSLIDTFNPFNRLPWGSGLTNPSVSFGDDASLYGISPGGLSPQSLASSSSGFTADDDRNPAVRRANEAARRAALGLPPLNSTG